MTYIEKQTQHIREILFSILGTTTAKTYFSYYGIFKDGLMFGLYRENIFYLRIAQQYITEAENTDNVYSLIDNKIKKSERFYAIPTKILQNISKYRHWFIASLAEIAENKNLSYYQRKKCIRSLPNMNINIERLLKKINIYSISELITRGEINAFVDLIKIGEDVDHIMLFKLYGAIHHQFIYTLSDSKKYHLIQNADEVLYQAGLRKRLRNIVI